MNIAKTVLSSSLLATGVLAAAVLAAGCSANAGDEASSSATDESQIIEVDYDSETRALRLEGNSLDPSMFPWSVELGDQVLGRLETPDDVLELEGIELSDQVRLVPWAGEELASGEDLGPGESVELNATMECWLEHDPCYRQYTVCDPPTPPSTTPSCRTVCVERWVYHCEWS